MERNYPSADTIKSTSVNKSILLFSNKKSNIIEIICFLFILLFVYAAISKLLDYTQFKIQLSMSPLLTAFAGWVAWIIPFSEIIIAILLSIPRFRLSALYLSFSLMVVFTSYIVAILNFSSFIPCSCGGVLQNMSWSQHLAFNGLFIILAIGGIILYNKKKIV